MLAFLVSDYEFCSSVRTGDIAVAGSAQFTSHTFVFAVSFQVTIAMIRKAGNAKSFRLALQQGVMVISIMSALIVAFDYMPFPR